MSSETIGVLCSLATALSWAIAIVLFKKAGSDIDALPLNLLKNVVGLALVVASHLIFETHPDKMSTSEFLMLVASGAVGVGVGDTLVLRALQLTGASSQAIIESVYSPAVVVISYFALGEVLSPLDAAGGFFILIAIWVAGVSRRDARVSKSDLTKGFLYGTSSMVMMAVAIVSVKPILERFDVFFCAMARLMGGMLAILIIAMVRGQLKPTLASALTPRRSFRYAVPGAVIGTYLSIVFWIASFKYAPAGIAALLGQTSTLFIVILAIAFLGEPLTARIAIAVALCLSGSALVLL